MKDEKRKSKINFIFASRFVSTIADQILLFLVPLVVYKITQSVSMSGLSFALEWLPRVVSFLLSGVWGDRIGGGKLFIRTDFYRGGLSLVFLIPLSLGIGSPFWLLTIMGACIGFFSSQAQVSLEITVKNNFDEVDIPSVQAKLQMCEQLSLILGPFLAGAILVYVDFQSLIAMAGALFILSGIISKAVFNNSFAHDKIEQNGKKSLASSFMRGWSNIWNSQSLRLLVLFSVLANLFFGVILALNPAIISGVFNASDQHLGLMYSIAGAVTICTLSIVSVLTRRFSVKAIGFTGISTFLTGALLLSQAPNYAIYVFLYALMTAGVMLTNIMTRTYRVRLIPSADFGVTVGVIMFLIKLAMPLSGFLVTGFAKQLGLQNLIFWSVTGSAFLFFLLWFFFFARRPMMLAAQK